MCPFAFVFFFRPAIISIRLQSNLAQNKRKKLISIPIGVEWRNAARHVNSAPTLESHDVEFVNIYIWFGAHKKNIHALQSQ